MSYVSVQQRVVVTFMWQDEPTRSRQPVEVEVQRSERGLLLQFPSGSSQLVPPEVIEALYDVWQEVPVGSSEARKLKPAFLAEES